MTLWFYKTEISVGIEPFVRQKTKVKSAFTCNQDEISSRDETRPGMK